MQLSRFAFPEKVVELEEEWGDHLMNQSLPAAAVSHFLGSFIY